MESAEEFLREILRLVTESQGNPQQVYPVWVQQQSQLNLDLLEALPQVVTLLSAREPVQQASVADSLVTFGNLIQQFPLGTHWLNLELGIAAYNQALQVYTYEAFPEDWAMTQNNLAIAYKNRIQGKRKDNLERAITAFEAALQVYTREAFPEDWAATQYNLANAYLERIQGGRADNIERAIAACKAALQVYTREAFPEDWAAMQNILANAYSERIQGKRKDNLEQAVALYEAALQVYTREAFPEDWAMTQHNLANAYSEHIQGKRKDNLERAITAFEAALQVYTREAFPEDWAMTQYNLATTYLDRIKGKRKDNLEQAIALYEAALQVYTREAFPEDWAMIQNNLTNAYKERIRGERADNIERAIAACEAALQVYTHESFPEQWAGTQNNLANAYKERIRGERADNLERAIVAYNQALQVYTYEAFPEDWAMTQNNLANAYSERIRGEQADNLERAIVACEAALQVYTREAFPEDWAATQNILAIAYSERIRGERADNIERAIVAFEAALQVYTHESFPEQWAMMQNNLAFAYSNRVRGKRADNLEWAISVYEQALQVRTHDAFPKDCRQTARNLGNLHFEQQTWSEAADAYEIALTASENLYQACILLDGKESELAESAEIFHRAAYSLTRRGNLQKAVEVLEQGCARGLNEALDRDRSDLTQLQQNNSDLFLQYQDITAQLRNLEIQQRLRMTSEERHSLTPEALRTEALRLRQILTETIRQIRQVEGYTDFLTQPDFDDIRQAARTGIPLVYLVPTPNGSIALIVTQTRVADLRLDNLTEASLGELLDIWFEAYNQSQANRLAWLYAIDQVTHQLWQPLMAPLIDHLKQQNFQQAALIPTGYLSLLPLHAAWVDDPGKRYVLDEICFTYAPSARSINAAADIAQHTGTDSILAIDNPLKDLPNSSREVTAAVASFPQNKVLKNEEATIESVLATLPHYNILHLSCHGTANLREPLNSGLAMSNGLLTLRDLLDLRLSEQGGIRLAVLSACETGLPGIELADEAIGLPTGLLQAGVAGVVASLWSVDDLSTMMLLVRFYDCWRNENLKPSAALRQAQFWMRDTTSQQKAKYFKKTNPDIFQELILLDPDYFAHPFHWAAFSYVGV